MYFRRRSHAVYVHERTFVCQSEPTPASCAGIAVRDLLSFFGQDLVRAGNEILGTLLDALADCGRRCLYVHHASRDYSRRPGLARLAASPSTPEPWSLTLFCARNVSR